MARKRSGNTWQPKKEHRPGGQPVGPTAERVLLAELGKKCLPLERRRELAKELLALKKARK